MRERLQKFLARAGVASRRACEQLIAAGRVSVNGRVVTELGATVESPPDRVVFDGREISDASDPVYLLAYKPPQMISSASDPEGRPVVTSLVPAEWGRVFPVGRLDWDSEGAVLLTNDGTLTQLLTHPKHEVAKVYMVKLRGLWNGTESRIGQVRGGVTLDDGYRTQPCEILFDSTTGRHTWLVVTLREGKNRQIRRMFETVGVDVLKIKRIAYGPVLLADMRPMEFRRLSEDEIDELYEAAGGKRPGHEVSRGRLPVARREGQQKVRAAARRPPGARASSRAAEASGRTAEAAGRTAEAAGRTARASGRTAEAAGRTARASGRAAEASGRAARGPRVQGEAGSDRATPGQKRAGAAQEPRAAGARSTERRPRSAGARPSRSQDTGRAKAGPAHEARTRTRKRSGGAR